MPGCSAPKCTNSHAKGLRLFHFPANEVLKADDIRIYVCANSTHCTYDLGTPPSCHRNAMSWRQYDDGI